MKTRIIIALIACSILVSFGATKIAKAPAKNATANHTASNAPIGGLVAEDK
ncbi:MAG: hypothetical protein JNK10_10315 [Cyclobacteriaceae bacterium]|nr:hypothetical protein [Cyclobacteriaceae bacterium]